MKYYLLVSLHLGPLNSWAPLGFWARSAPSARYQATDHHGRLGLDITHQKGLLL
jgi:hypothetical protein